MSLTIFNVKHGETVHTPLFIVHGQCADGVQSGIVSVQSKTNSYPPLFYEVNGGFFKAPVHLNRGSNELIFMHSQGRVVNGYPQYSDQNTRGGGVAMTINYDPLPNKPVHLCLLVAKDSPGYFDTTSEKGREEGNGIDLAVKKLRVGARLMQAFTNEQMLRAGFGQRTFNFAEEEANDTLFEQEQGRVSRPTVKIHVIRSKKTLAELRDPNLAQQNSKGTNTGGLFGIAMDELKHYGPLANEQRPFQAAVMFLDTHWDTKLRLILTHAALGGGDGELKLAIFGSHGLYSWPSSLEKVVPAFQDDRKSNINEVANDCNECGTYWECFNITFGAFLHEIGHLLGCPHQVNGVMLRDYVRINRSFASRETYCMRTKSNGMSPLLPKDECGWNRLDLLRFLHHPSFRLPSDSQDPTFGLPQQGGGPVILPLGNGQATIKSPTGIYAVEVIKDDLARGYLEFSPRSLGGQGAQNEIHVTSQQLKNLLPRDKQNGDYDVRVLTAGGEAFQKDVEHMLTSNTNALNVDIGDGKGQKTAIKSAPMGQLDRGNKFEPVFFNPHRVVNVRVYWGGAVDGIRIDLGKEQDQPQAGSPPPVPQRDYKSPFNKLVSGLKDMAVNRQPAYQAAESSVLAGNVTNNYTDFPLQQGETIAELRFRSGAWIDAVQIVTSTGRSSQMFGRADGGSANALSPPQGYQIIGLYGSLDRWLGSLGVIYAPA